ncbi:hypothetical protein [Algoriphagus aquimarinus]|uniref:LPXTG cell wall anchor domain-containing protein n=1 Tax=Algoriphagus aquimarinus TaxID=237018 RepID=A0A1I0W0E3_9BACT|nr:hypothetical protein [Algoriphagus aquimarinus]SFA81603.1 hypothetical protein SAMN04489723_101459 [Algoriphagus aquimarinus]
MKWKLFIGLFLVSFYATAHQSDISTAMLIERSEGQWVFQFNTSLTALQYEVQTIYGQNSYATPEEFQRLVIEHMKANFQLVFNQDNPAVISNTYVKLGHAFSVVFELEGVPAEISEVFVKSESFKDIYKNQSLFGIVRNGETSNQFILDNDNQHEARVLAEGDQFVSAISGTDTNYLVISLGVLLLALGAALYYKFKQKSSFYTVHKAVIEASH